MCRWARWKRIDKFEREWNGDTSHMLDVIDASPRPAWLVSRVTALLIATALIGVVGLATPTAARVLDQPPAVSPYSLTPERIAISAVTGGLALARSAGRIGTGNARRGAIVALAMGPIGLVIGGLVVITADGGLGTGNGLGGGIVAMVVWLTGMGLGGLALARSGCIA
jgi:hypothetical protein